jgi:small conductance mechanosensitive channel
MNLLHISQQMKNLFGDFYSPLLVVLRVIGILLLSYITLKVCNFAISKFFERKKIFQRIINEKKINTMATLIKSVMRYAIYIITGIIILTDVFKFTTILAAAGIGGVAVGLGAQSLIKDVISGFFIVMEDQFAIGDSITIDNFNGIVEEMELRVTKLRGSNGDLHIIPNGDVRKVTNQSRGVRTLTVDIPVSYKNEISVVVEAARKACAKVSPGSCKLVERPNVLGITDLGKDMVNLRITAKTNLDAQGEVEREIRLLVKEEFSKNGLEFPGIVRVEIGNEITKEGDING